MVKSRQRGQKLTKAQKKTTWWRAAEAVAKSPAGAVAVTFREGWHSRMSRPKISPIRFASVAARSGCPMRKLAARAGGFAVIGTNSSLRKNPQNPNLAASNVRARRISAGPHSRNVVAGVQIRP